VRIYDTSEHQITGFSQQQGSDQSLTFTSQFGLMRVADLASVLPLGADQSDPTAGVAAGRTGSGTVAAMRTPQEAGLTTADEILILAELRQK
jgi:hypothetical protein